MTEEQTQYLIKLNASYNCNCPNEKEKTKIAEKSEQESMESI